MKAVQNGILRSPFISLYTVQQRGEGSKGVEEEEEEDEEDEEEGG